VCSSKKLPPEKTAALPALLTAAHEQPWPFKKLLQEIARSQNKNVEIHPPALAAGLARLENPPRQCGLHLNFRSDAFDQPDVSEPASRIFSANAAAGLACRRFEISRL